MSTLYHLRLNVRKVQDYIFQVPKLKFMLGANSKIGELFSKTLPDSMPESKSIFSEEQLSPLSEELRERFKKNILSSSGGHFEAVFTCEIQRDTFIEAITQKIATDIPDLEYSIDWKEFDATERHEEVMKKEATPARSSWMNPLWYDLPYYELCNQDGISCATHIEDKEKIGNKAYLMEQQADSFYILKTEDAISKFYKELQIPYHKLAKTLKDLAYCGNSLKDNMLAYIKMDGNGTGDRFRELMPHIDNVLDGFIQIEEFWAKNRARIWESLKETLKDYSSSKSLPYLLLMLGGDDLFLVCVPEFALDIATTMAEKMGTDFPISAGIAFVKESYPIGLANHLAESCLESAKAGSYRQKGKPAYIDWHVHFDSVYQDIPEIRRNAYLLQYECQGKKVTEILSLRPYSLSDTQDIITEVKKIAITLDDPKQESANNKVKGYRSVLKNGHSDVKFFTEMLLADESYENIKAIKGCKNDIEESDGSKILRNSALDKIELVELYRKKNPKESASCKA